MLAQPVKPPGNSITFKLIGPTNLGTPISCTLLPSEANVLQIEVAAGCRSSDQLGEEGARHSPALHFEQLALKSFCVICHNQL